jgi:EAL domain-containing protein (putative c-di-GMP-specific phosphodiesterase class I)
MKPDMGIAANETVPEAPKPRVLLVDDEETLRDALTRGLGAAYDVVAVASAEEAIALVNAGGFEAVLSDVNLEGMSGVEFLQRLRESDFDLPVLLMSGRPELDVAIRACEFGAMRYMVKPVELRELRGILAKAVGMRRLAEARRTAFELVSGGGPAIPDKARLTAVLESGLRSLRVAWQPIVSWPRRRVAGYEALSRSRVPVEELLAAAARLGRMRELGRGMRDAAASAAEVAPAVDLFVNLHAEELLDDALYSATSPLSRVAPQVVLEVTERAPLDTIPDLPGRVARLRKLGFRIALDDLGAGYSGLASFALLEPEAVKIDLALVRDVHHSPTRQRLIASIVTACRDLGCSAIAEGVELPAERDTLVELGCELFQGFLFARPGFAFPEPQF